jgi:hypothetical protein
MKYSMRAYLKISEKFVKLPKIGSRFVTKKRLYSSLGRITPRDYRAQAKNNILGMSA